MTDRQWDVLVAGAGPAGLACALAAARRGLKVLVLERQSKATHGHPYVLEIEDRAFQVCGIDAPAGEEVPVEVRGVHAYSASGWRAFASEGHPMHTVILRPVVRRMAAIAHAAGATLRYGETAGLPILDGDRVVGFTSRDSKGNDRPLYAKVVVDATGFPATLTRRLPAACGIDFTDRDDDQIHAEARLYRIDPVAARAAADAGRFTPEIANPTIGRHGSYSTWGYVVSLERDVAWLLAGIQRRNFPPTPGQSLDALAADLGFLKEIVCQGGGPIRVRRAGLKLVCDGFATVGESAGMVIPLQASGVTSAMIAGYQLGERLAEVCPHAAPTTADLWPWAAAYQRGRGAVLASYDVNRRSLQYLDPVRETEPLFKSGVTQAEDVYRAMHAEPLRISPASIPGRVKGIVRHPLLAAKMAPTIARVALAEWHWRRYPTQWDAAAFATWSRLAARILP